MGILIIHLKMGPVEKELINHEFENDEMIGTALTDFANDGEVSQKSTPTTLNSIF